MTLNSTGIIVGPMAAMALLVAACSAGTAPDQAAERESASAPATSIASPEEDPTPSVLRADLDDAVESAASTALPDVADEESSPPLVLDLPTATPSPEPPARPTSGPASPPVPEGREAPEEPFTSDEAAAIACANLENALRALETGDLDAVQLALAGADEYVDSTGSDQLRAVAATWAEVDDLARAESSIWDALGVCERLGYSL